MWKKPKMNKSKILAVVVLMISFIATGAVQAEISADKARDIGEKNLKRLTEQSYHFRVEYDTVVVLPVHSKTVWKNDFYLLYFLKDDYFQVEMEIDRETGDPIILAMGKMSQPYQETPTGIFNHRYFCVDSILHFGSIRQRLEQDSARLVYFGVIPKLGKRGVIWELFSNEGPAYISMGGPQIKLEQLIRDINISQQKGGNYPADSIRMAEIITEMDRLKSLSHEEKVGLQLKPQSYDSLMAALKEEHKSILIKFPGLGRQFPLNDDPDTTSGNQ